MTEPAGDFQTLPESAFTPARASRYTMLVLANDEADAVQAAGGLLFDRASAGWIVDVRIPLPAVEIPFRILGVPVGALADRLPASEDRPDSLVVSGQLLRRDGAVREVFCAATKDATAEVTMWGGPWPGEIGRGSVHVEHRLSRAAVAFKAHALAAAGLPSRAAAAEAFHSSRHGFGSPSPRNGPT